MRRVFGAGLVGLFFLCMTGLVGCGPDKKAVVPTKDLELPKEGPVPAGGAKGGKGMINPPDNAGQPPPSDQ